MSTDGVTTVDGVRPLPGLQAEMAELVVAGRVRYRPDQARWFEGPNAGDVAIRARGRTLRELRRASLITVDMDAERDERGAYPVVLTAEGRARHQSPAAETSG